MKDQSFDARYFRLLKSYVMEPAEKHLAAVGVLARELVIANVPAEDGADLHEKAVHSLAQELPDTNLRDVAHLISAPLIEMFIAYGLAFRERLEECRLTDEALEMRSRQLTALNVLGQQVSASLSLSQAVRSAIQGILGPIVPDLALMFLREGDSLVLQGIGPKNSTLKDLETPLHRVGECLCGLAVSKGKAIYSSNIHTDPRCTWEECKKAGVTSFAALPMYSGDEIIGVLGLASATERVFEEEAVFLEALCGATSLGVRNAQLYEQIQDHAAEVEQQVVERTDELEAANKELEAFTYSVSHDLKAPLRAIDGYSAMLAEELGETLDPEGRRMLGEVRQETKHMTRLIEELLTFSRLGREELTIADVDMGKLAQTTFEQLTVLSTGREIIFAVTDLPAVRADLGMIRQVWANLLENAIKFTGQREVAHIEVGYREEPGQHVFYVRDNGAGFEMQYADKMFGVFQRLHREDEFPGTGVGLATVRRIIERHRGEIWAVGEVDHGATVFFRLPRTDSAA